MHKLLSPGPGQLGRIITQIRQLQQLSIIIKDLLPPPLDRHCRLAAVDGHTVVLHTDSAAWATRARFHCPALMAALRAAPGCHALRDVRVKVRPGGAGQPAPTAGGLLPPALSAAGADTLRQAAAGLEPGAMRDALLRVASRGPEEKDG